MIIIFIIIISAHWPIQTEAQTSTLSQGRGEMSCLRYSSCSKYTCSRLTFRLSLSPAPLLHCENLVQLDARCWGLTSIFLAPTNFNLFMNQTLALHLYPISLTPLLPSIPSRGYHHHQPAQVAAACVLKAALLANGKRLVEAGL